MIGWRIFDSPLEYFHGLGNLFVRKFVNLPGMIRMGKGGVFLDGSLEAPDRVFGSSVRELELTHSVPEPRIVG